MKRLALIIAFLIAFSFTVANAEEWICPNCEKNNTTNYCTTCGTKREETWICPNCELENDDAFCGNCGKTKPVDVSSLIGTWKASVGTNSRYFIFLNNGILLDITNEGAISPLLYSADTERITISQPDDQTEIRITDYIIKNNQLIISIFPIPYEKVSETVHFPVAKE